MCALRKEMSVDFSDLRTMQIVCRSSARCQTVITIQIDAKDTLTPKACPGCNSAFGEDFTKALETFKEAYRGFVGTVNMPEVRFSIPFDERVN